MANKALTKFLRWLNDQHPGMVYTSGLDRTRRRGLIHFNIAINGELPSLRRMKDKWFELTGCHNIKGKPAHSNVGYYIARRASELPNTKDDAPPEWHGITKRFRRIRYSKGLYPDAPKKREQESPWVACFVGDEQYEEMFNSTVADTALPREAGDTADQPTLTGVVHGHEGERRRHGVLVQDVRTRTHRRRSGGDSRELDANDETVGRAVVGAPQ